MKRVTSGLYFGTLSNGKGYVCALEQGDWFLTFNGSIRIRAKKRKDLISYLQGLETELAVGEAA